QVDEPDMLVHADRDDLVEHALPRYVAIIALLDRDAIAQPRVGGASSRFRDLLRAQRHAEHRDAVVPRGVDRQPAPATADIEEALAGREPELAAQMIELRLLRRVDVFVAGVKITAGI